jgi:hypothetical protein
MSRLLPALGALALSAAGCLAPPALMQAPSLDVEAVRSSLASEAERIEVRLDDGTRLAGWYAPADEGAPLVLMLLESGASADSTRSSRAHLVRQLADLGFASLFIDYTGVGASGGRRSTRNLARDARAMWEFALRRVDGDPGRVVLRATSLGTLAALSLVEDGARPAGVILLLPVMPDSVTARFARSFYGAAAGWLASALFRDVVDLDPAEVIANAPLRWMLVQADADQLTTPDERCALAAAVERQGGRLESLPYDHLVATAALLRLSPGEIAFLTEVVPGVRDSGARWPRFVARLSDAGEAAAASLEADDERLRAIVGLAHNDDPLRLLAAARSGSDPMTATRVRWMLARRPGEVDDLEGLAALADLDDPAGPLPLDLLEEVASIQDFSAQFGMPFLSLGAELIGAGAGSLSQSAEPFQVSVTITLSGRIESTSRLDLAAVFQRLLARGLSDGDARRQLARMLLKANRYPDRVVEGPDGEFRLEYRAQAGWTALDLSPRDPQATAASGAGGWLFTLDPPAAQRP